MSALTAEKRTRALVLSTDPIGEHMPGPAIRAYELAKVLGRYMDVVLASTVAVEGAHPVAELRLAVGPALGELAQWADVIFTPPALVYLADELRLGPTPLVVDIYDPFHLENLESPGAEPAAQDQVVARLSGVLNCALRRGDYFTCASERQRDFWLGSLAALGRVNTYTYADSPVLESLVATVPYGLPEQPPVRSGPGVRGALAGIGPDDKVVLWGGGVYDWLDPLSVVRAVDRLRLRWPALRLVFMGLRHPNPDIPEMGTAARLVELSDRLGLTGRYVFFNRGWVPYRERANFLLDADVAVSAHLDHVETRYSFRSRVLDYLWAGLPMVLTGGDVLAEELARAGAAVTVPAGDDYALEAALDGLLASPPDRSAISAVARGYQWERAAQPLVDFCLAPRRAPDALPGRVGPDEAAARG